MPNLPPHGDPSEDGHPCEAALEFRRAAIRCRVVDELPADVVDLATAYAWIGKAVSRTTACAAWLEAGADPNTWHGIRAMAAYPRARSLALSAAKSAEAAAGMERQLRAVRNSPGFKAACATMEAVAAGDPGETWRSSWLQGVAAKLPGPDVAAAGARGGTVAEVVSLDAWRTRKSAAN